MKGSPLDQAIAGVAIAALRESFAAFAMATSALVPRACAASMRTLNFARYQRSGSTKQ